MVKTEDITQNVNEFNNKLSSLVKQLLKSELYDHKKKATLMTTFVRADTLTYKKTDHPLQYLGHYLSDGIKTELVHRESKVIEHKSSSAVSISKDASYFLSRNIDELKGIDGAEYIIAGTFVEMENGAMVNVEVIEISTSEVVSAAREFFPNTLFWPAKSVVSRNGMLYREDK
ncbi:hypothetical protein GCM10011501_32220 [Thalassotalea profundi]|uniref:FlgO domain-containing protein n=1 Tax=Thalassotalea profundi TaxID=2036687 RepID=A0ABQ3J0D1_9GAMM|nr:hypothetical protein GCM10011501_32220 [Thalassotalea profundi]